MEKQPLRVAEVPQKMPPEAGEVARAEWRGRGWREMGTELGARGSRGGWAGRRELFALDFVPVFLLQRPRKTQQGVN